MKYKNAFSTWWNKVVAKYWVGGPACCFDKMTSDLTIVVEQKTIILQNIGELLHPHDFEGEMKNIRL